MSCEQLELEIIKVLSVSTHSIVEAQCIAVVRVPEGKDHMAHSSETDQTADFSTPDRAALGRGPGLPNSAFLVGVSDTKAPGLSGRRCPL